MPVLREPNTQQESAIEQLWRDASEPLPENRAFAIEGWKKTVDVQMHFNDICMTVRNLAITLLTAAIGFAAYLMKEGVELDIGIARVPLGVIVVAAGLAGWVAFWAMDRYWYHNFLKAAVIHAGRIEARWRQELPELLLSTTIGKASVVNIGDATFDSGRRVNIFYALGAVVLIVTGIIVWSGQSTRDVNPPGARTATEAPAQKTPSAQD